MNGERSFYVAWDQTGVIVNIGVWRLEVLPSGLAVTHPLTGVRLINNDVQPAVASNKTTSIIYTHIGSSPGGLEIAATAPGTGSSELVYFPPDSDALKRQLEELLGRLPGIQPGPAANGMMVQIDRALFDLEQTNRASTPYL